MGKRTYISTGEKRNPETDSRILNIEQDEGCNANYQGMELVQNLGGEKKAMPSSHTKTILCGLMNYM